MQNKALLSFIATKKSLSVDSLVEKALTTQNTCILSCKTEDQLGF